MKVIIWDYEVFRYDILLGMLFVDLDTNTYEVKQTWDQEEIRKLYWANEKTLWIGWNSNNYDDLIMECVVRQTKSPYEVSKAIVEKRYFSHCNLNFLSYDLTNPFAKASLGLKQTEAILGDDIETTDVDFDLPRKLTPLEKKKTEKYNLADLMRTYKNFQKMRPNLELRLSIIHEFNIPIKRGLRMTGTQIAASALGAKPNPALVYMPVPPQLFPTLRLKNEALKEWFMGEKFRNGETLQIKICGTTVTIASGGMHSTTKKYQCKKAIYADISGYYNLIMINFGLLPRTLDENGKETYVFMYHEQLRLKKINPAKRKTYKEICLGVFGAMNNEYSDFYDPNTFSLVTTNGELFVFDLLEKLDGLGTAFNVNTDGLMFEPYDWKDEEKIRGIIQEWVDRNKFGVKTGIITDYFGRDVNCYIMREEDGNIVAKGDIFKNFDLSDNAFAMASFFNCKEPPIIAKGVAAALLDGILPEDFVEQNKRNLCWFQYVCKKGGFKSLTFDEILPGGLEKSSTPIKSPSRVFASNKQFSQGMVYKHTDNKGIKKRNKYPSLPPNVFVYNKEILSNEAIDSLVDQIDWNYYVERIYRQLGTLL